MPTLNTKVPVAMNGLLQGLFGIRSRHAGLSHRSNAQWRRVLRAVLRELDGYWRENVTTDQLHASRLARSLVSAEHALAGDEFWPGFAEGILRFSLELLGDYPDHRQRKRGRRENGHYRLDRLRSIHYTQHVHQKYLTLHAAADAQLPNVPRPLWRTWKVFHDEHGFHQPERTRMDWFRQKHPNAYASVF